MAFFQSEIDSSKVVPPTVYFTTRAYEQLALILKNDFTLDSLYFRIGISGKGCDGFTYSVMFSEIHEQDFCVAIQNPPKKNEFDLNGPIQVVLDPFAAFYLTEFTVDFIQDFNQDAEGFVITNHLQEKYKGKFFNKEKADLPPLKARSHNRLSPLDNH